MQFTLDVRVQGWRVLNEKGPIGLRRWVHACLFTASVLGSGACVEVDLAGKQCAKDEPKCVTGYECHTPSNVCVRVGTLEEDAGDFRDSGSADSGSGAEDSGDRDAGVGEDAMMTDAEGPFVFTDDEFDGEFAEGSFAGTVWDTDRVALAAGEAQGEFTSRLASAGRPVAWESLAWSAGAPYGKALPNDGAEEMGYGGHNVSMADNVVLLHLDAQNSVAPGNRLDDTSGGSNHFIVSGPDPVQTTPGVFGPAIQVDPPRKRLRLVADKGRGPSFGRGDFSVLVWVQTSSTATCEVSSRVVVGADHTTPLSPSIWLGCSSFDALPGICASGNGLAAAQITSGPETTVDGVLLCGTTRIADGAWHQLALTKAGEAPSTISLFVDGALEATNALVFADPINFDDVAASWTVGGLANGAFGFPAAIDELAVFSRALQSAEIQSTYVRGVSRMRFQVQECAGDDCGTFIGPDLTAATFFDDLTALSGGSPVTLPANLKGQGLRYRVLMESSDPAIRPTLSHVTIRGN